MGLTHLAHINGYLAGDCTFDIYDPSFSFRLASFFNIRNNIRFLRKLPESTSYDAVVITSPPAAHSPNFLSTIDLSERFFIEKPLALTKADLDKALDNGKFVTCGYVLRNNPCIEYLRDLIGDEAEISVFVNVTSNVGKNGGDDWRFDLKRGGGCINELGSHAVNLGLCFTENKGLRPDEVRLGDLTLGSFRLAVGQDNCISVSGNWDTDVRKTTYQLSLKGDGIDLRSDLQSVFGQHRGETVEWSPRKSAVDVNYYMRGVDFAFQNKAFLSRYYSQKDLQDAVLTDEILEVSIRNV